LKTIQLIYNEINKNGKYKAIYFDTIGSSANEGVLLKMIENGHMKLYNPSSEQLDQIYGIIRSGMDEIWRYDYKEFHNADIDNTLLLSITDTEDHLLKEGQRYYNWQNSKSPMLVIPLFRLIDEIIEEGE
jgi:hypothetical protein